MAIGGFVMIREGVKKVRPSLGKYYFELMGGPSLTTSN